MKKFSAARRDWNKGFEFELEWWDKEDKPQSEKFTAYPARIPGGVWLDVIRIGDMGSKPVWDFWQYAMEPEDFVRYSRLVHYPDDSARVDAQTIRDIMDWLMEQDTGRPTTPSEP